MTKPNSIRPMEVAWLESEAEENARKRFTYERCVVMEMAMQAAGFRRDTVYWSVGILCAKLAVGWQPIVRELDRLAGDAAIGCDSTDLTNRKRSLRRALSELQACGLLSWTAVQPVGRRTRGGTVLTIQIDGPALKRGELRFHEGQNAEQQQGQQQGQNEGQREGQTRDKTRDNERDRPGTDQGQNANHSSYIPLNPNTLFNPSSPSLVDSEQPVARKSIQLTTTARDFDFVLDPELDQALDAAGVECKRLVCREAQTHRVSRAELLDACFVVQHTHKLTGGSLVAWIRNGGWPVSGVPTAERIRERRREAAERICDSVLRDAESRSPRPPESLISDVMRKRLREAGLEEQMQSLVGCVSV